MRKMIMIASAAAMAVAMPALAQAQGRGHGQSGAHVNHGASAGVRHDTTARTSVRSGGHARTDARANVRARTRTGASVDRVRDSDGDGIPDYRDRRDNQVTGNRYNGQACPPGLANRTPACVPPGQARHMYRVGQALPASYGGYLGYDELLGRLPVDYRDDIPAGYRYVYQGDSVYVVDPTTRLIRSIVDIIR